MGGTMRRSRTRTASSGLESRHSGRSVSFSGITDRVRVAVFDDRVNGFCSKIQPVERSFEVGETQDEATAWGIERGYVDGPSRSG